MFSIIATILLTSLTVIWSIPTIIGHLFGLQLYRVTAQSKVLSVTSKLSKRCTILDNDKPRGFIFGFPYIGYVSESTSSGSGGSTKSVELYIYTTNKFYKKIMDQENEENKSMITIYERQGHYFYLEYVSRMFDCSNIVCRLNQSLAVNGIMSYYRSSRTKSVVSILHGEPGSGKSMIGMLLAKEFTGSLCDSFNPFSPNDSLSLIYNSVNPNEGNPLIIMLEEFDRKLSLVHEGKIIEHKDIPIQITDKPSWNQFFDKIDRGMYPYLILILTTNKDPSEIDLLDSSYLRLGRVNLRIKIEKGDAELIIPEVIKEESDAGSKKNK